MYVHEIMSNGFVKKALREVNVPILWLTRTEVVFANKECCNLFGYDSEKIYELKPTDLILESASHFTSKDFFEQLYSKNSVINELHGIKKDNSVFPFESNSSIFNKNNVDIIVMHMRDLSKRSTVERMDRTFSEFVQKTHEGIIVHKNGIIRDINNAIKQIFGYSAAELKGEHYGIFIPKQHRKKVVEEIELGEKTELEAEGIKKNREMIHLKIMVYNWGNKSGIISFADITEQKNNELLLRESRTNLFSALDYASEGVWNFDMRTRKISLSKSCCDIFGLNPADNPFDIERFSTMINPKDFNTMQNNWRALFNGDMESYNAVYRIKKPDGKISWVQSRVAVSSYNENSKPDKLTGIVIDVSNLKKTEMELMIAKKKAEQASKIKSAFLAQMSHEIRTPLNIILNYAYLIEEDAVDSENITDIMESIKGMRSASKRITRTIESLILMSELQTESYEFNNQVIHLDEEIIQKTYGEFEEKADDREIAFDLDLRTDEDALVEGDLFSLEVIFNHLADNAIKYNKHGGKIVISLHRNDGRYVVKISDTGIGIGKEYLRDIFLPFSQEERGYTRGYDGNGLGLALVQAFCKLNDVFIKIQSEKGEGTTVTMEFKALKASKAAQKEDSTASIEAN